MRPGRLSHACRRWVWTALAVAFAVVLVTQPVEAQCAMCRSLLTSEEGQRLAAAFRSGILFLLAAPFVAFAVVASLALRARPPDSRLAPDPDGAPSPRGGTTTRPR